MVSQAMYYNFSSGSCHYNGFVCTAASELAAAAEPVRPNYGCQVVVQVRILMIDVDIVYCNVLIRNFTVKHCKDYGIALL